MNYRKNDIFPAGYPFVPEEADVRRACRSQLWMCGEKGSIIPMTSYLNGIVDPYVREYSVTVMHELIMKVIAGEEMEELRINANVLEQINDDFRRIVRRAREEQIEEEHATLSPTHSATHDTLPVTKEWVTQYVEDCVEQTLRKNHLMPGCEYCTYSVPGAAKTRDEIERDLERAASMSAQSFARFLKKYEEKNYLDFRGDSPAEVHAYMKERYHLTYDYDCFRKYFRA